MFGVKQYQKLPKIYPWVPGGGGGGGIIAGKSSKLKNDLANIWKNISSQHVTENS